MTDHTHCVANPAAARARRLDADLVMLATLGIGALVALAIGAQFNQLGTALTVGAVLLLLTAGVFLTARGTLFARLTLPVLAMAMVALHIQLGRGTLEFHFGVFATLGILLVYRDWRPLVAGAARPLLPGLPGLPGPVGSSVGPTRCAVTVQCRPRRRPLALRPSAAASESPRGCR